MCDMQKMLTREDESREEEEEMNLNFAAFSSAASGVTGTHFVTTSGHVPVTKLQQGVQANGASMSQVVGMVGSDGGVQYVRTLEGGAALSALSASPQIINLPITLPGAKPGDPQPTVQIQVLAPNLLQQQQPKYQMQIPIQGFQQSGAVLTLAYSESENGGLQILGNMPEGLQLVTMNPEMQLVQPSQLENKEVIQQQLLLSQGQMMDAQKDNNNHIVIKQECDENTNDDENSQGTETTNDSTNWIGNSNQDLFNYIHKIPQQQNQTLPSSLQQYLRLNVGDSRTDDADNSTDDNKDNVLTGRVEDESTPAKKKKKYKKKPPKASKPKPGQVVIATATDGTPIFCCPECQMAYPEKEQLELHLSVHKIERRFICGICGAGLKRKEHLERHKLGHNPERPYVCAVCRKGFKRREHLNLHTVIHSGVKTELCLECGKGFYRKDHLRKHARSHESKRQRENALAVENGTNTNLPIVEAAEITIHVPTSDNVQVPVQINIPQHVVSSLQAQQASLLVPQQQQQKVQQQQQRIVAQQQQIVAQQQQTTSNAQLQLEALLQQHT